jgi:hypothetical protein
VEVGVAVGVGVIVGVYVVEEVAVGVGVFVGGPVKVGVGGGGRVGMAVSVSATCCATAVASFPPPEMQAVSRKDVNNRPHKAFLILINYTAAKPKIQMTFFLIAFLENLFYNWDGNTACASHGLKRRNLWPSRVYLERVFVPRFLHIK